MLKLAKKYEKRLDCICGLCDHDCMDKTCTFNKIMDSMHPEEEQKKAILALMDDVTKDIIAVATQVKGSKIKKTTRAKMKPERKKA